jgi:hypothetical protein
MTVTTSASGPGRCAAGKALLLSVLVAGCVPAPFDDTDLVHEIEAFERSIDELPRADVQGLLRRHAERNLGRTVRVSSATVASTYVRDNRSRIYFGTNYDESDHLFLSDLDSELHRVIEDHRHWVSIVKTYPSRQLSYELPLDEATFRALEPGQSVTVSCRIAALIRGKSVYCVPLEWQW